MKTLAFYYFFALINSFCFVTTIGAGGTGHQSAPRRNDAGRLGQRVGTQQLENGNVAF